MKFALIICTYMRPNSLFRLLQSIVDQSIYPDEIIIVDGSLNSEINTILNQNYFKNIQYYLVAAEQRGLTRQRNYGVAKVSDKSEIVCFLDDDTVLHRGYFEQILRTYAEFPKALGVGGYISNENKFQFVGNDYQPTIKEYCFDGWKQPDGSRFVLRKRLGLDSDCPPGYSSLYSHGRSVGFLPPSGKTYEVEMLMGGVSSFRKVVFDDLQFSTYFEGYGLYEDADFSLKVAKKGKLYLNTAAQLDHLHDSSGRPNQYQYGKMVVRNGWYVWRTHNPQPCLRDTFKWHAITIVLLLIRFSNIVTTNKRKAAWTEALGRTVGWWSLLFSKPK